jgi:hypothetical protein
MEEVREGGLEGGWGIIVVSSEYRSSARNSVSIVVIV